MNAECSTAIMNMWNGNELYEMNVVCQDGIEKVMKKNMSLGVTAKGVDYGVVECVKHGALGRCSGMVWTG